MGDDQAGAATTGALAGLFQKSQGEDWSKWELDILAGHFAIIGPRGIVAARVGHGYVEAIIHAVKTYDARDQALREALAALNADRCKGGGCDSILCRTKADAVAEIESALAVKP